MGQAKGIQGDGEGMASRRNGSTEQVSTECGVQHWTRSQLVVVLMIFFLKNKISTISFSIYGFHNNPEGAVSKRGCNTKGLGTVLDKMMQL